MKETAVEWLVDKYIIVGGITKTMVKQAKEMEKEQIIDAHSDGRKRQVDNSEQYYNQTFKSE